MGFFCAKQNLPLQGQHHVSGWSHSGRENVPESLLCFCAESGDAPLSCHFSGLQTEENV